MKSAPLLPSAFGNLLIRWNGLDAAGFAGWEFLPGMRFRERAAWWGEGSDRGVPHEGLDLLWYRRHDGRRRSLDAGARVPAVYPGRVVALVDDFLGRSVFVAHECGDGRGRRLHTVCGHLLPAAELGVGSLVGEGDLIGTIAESSGTAPPHLHVTVALIDRTGGPGQLDWSVLQDATKVLLLDPQPLLCVSG